MNEKDSLQRILTRIRKNIVLFIVIPFIIGIAAYLFTSFSSATYKASAQIMLGNFQDTKMTNIGALTKDLTSPLYLKKLDKNHTLNVNNIAQHIKIKKDDVSKVLTLTLQGNNKKKVTQSLQTLVNDFMQKSNRIYMQQENNIKANISNLKGTKASGLAAIKKENSVYKQQQALIDLRPSTLETKVSTSASGSSPKKRAVVGFLIGIMLDVVIILVPEILRRPEPRE